MTSNKQPCLVVQSFGKESEYRRAIFCLLSYAAHSGNYTAILFTDNPAYFQKHLTGFALDIILLTPEKIKSMRGEIDFLHRMKIALIEEAFTLHDGPLLYADSDTFFVADPMPLVQQLNSQTAFMHTHEYQFDYLKTLPLPSGETFHAFHKLISEQVFKGYDGQTIAVNSTQSSWNAGVMFFHPTHKNFLPDVYALTDQFYPTTRNHASEQYAFSIILQTHTLLKPCESVIYHYWYRVKKEIMDNLLETLFLTWPTEKNEQLNHVRALAQTLPSDLSNHILTLRDNAIQAFHENQFKTGYRITFRALQKKPFNGKFLRDVAYHTRRAIKQWMT